MVARDVTGDGNADLDVRVVVRRSASGSRDPVDLDVLLVYQVQGDAIARIFATKRRTQEEPRPGARAVHSVVERQGVRLIDTQPGRVTGWTEKSYPWSQDQRSGAVRTGAPGGIAHIWLVE